MLGVHIQAQPDGTNVGYVRVPTIDEARFAISQFHRKKIGYKRIHVSLVSSDLCSSAFSLRFVLWINVWNSVPHTIPELCSEAVVDWLGKTQSQCSCYITPRCSYLNHHCKEPGCSFQMLKGRSLICYYTALLRSNTMINHGLHALVQGLWVWRWYRIIIMIIKMFCNEIETWISIILVHILVISIWYLKLDGCFSGMKWLLS